MSRNYDDFIRSYVSTFAPKGEAPERFHFWTAVSTVAGAIRRRCYIDAGTFRWFPNFYVVLVGPPGVVKKSTVINIGARLLREVPHAHIGADCTTWQNFVQDVADAKDYLADGGVPGADLAEAMMNQSYTVTSALTMQISEWGTFLDPNDKMQINVLTELYDGKVDQGWKKKTKTQGEDDIMNPFVNMIAGTTPDWINDNFTRQFGGWGLSSRCIFIHASEPERRIANPAKLWAGTFDETMKRFVEDLAHISMLQGAFDFEPEAEDFREAWYEQHSVRHAQMEKHPHKDPWLSYYMARKYDQVMKLSLVLAVSQWDTPRIALHHVREAVRRCDEIETEISHIFRGKGTIDNRVARNRDVWNGICAAIIRAGGEVEEWRVQNYIRGFMSGGDAQALVKQLMDSQQLRRAQYAGTVVFTFGDNTLVDEKAMKRELGEAVFNEFRDNFNLATEDQSATSPPSQPAQADVPPAPSPVPSPPPQPAPFGPSFAQTPPEYAPSPSYSEPWQPPYVPPEEDPAG